MKDLLTFRRRVDARNEHSNGRSRWHKRLGKVMILSGVVAAVLVVITSFVTVPYEAITPGSTVEVSRLISVSGMTPLAKSGSVSLVDVNLVPLSAFNYLFFRLNPDNQIVPKGEILGLNSQTTYDEQGVLDMASAQQAATYVAFQQLGYPIHVRQVGVAVYEIETRSPASSGKLNSSLVVGDVIRQVGGAKISDVASLRNVLLRHQVDELVKIEVQHYGQSKRHSVVIRLGLLKANGAGNEVCIPGSGTIDRSIQANVGTPCLGIVLMPMYQIVNQPYAVNLNAQGIIGPSAGLAFTLGLIKELDRQDLTSGLSIAATGTIAMDGSIGDVGGVKQKTIAVRNSGTSVFFVPKSEFQTAKLNAGPNLRLFAVTSISQAIQDLKSLGGRIIMRAPR